MNKAEIQNAYDDIFGLPDGMQKKKPVYFRHIMDIILM